MEKLLCLSVSKKGEIQNNDNTEISEWQIQRVQKGTPFNENGGKVWKPVVSLIDTPGAYPGLEAEERGQGEAIARNLIEMTRLKVLLLYVLLLVKVLLVVH